MASTAEEIARPDFEIDHPDDYAPYFLNNALEVLHFLQLLLKRGSLVSAHLDDSSQFFLTAIVAVDGKNSQMFIDPAPSEIINKAALSARRITLEAHLDRIKIQMHLSGLEEGEFAGQRSLCASLPTTILRLQRRDFFRLEPPLTQSIHCGLALEDKGNRQRTLDLTANDISGGGISLLAPLNQAEHFVPDQLFRNSRLEIPGEGVLLVNLRVRKCIEFSSLKGEHHLRVGCEFVGLPNIRLAMIERYITRIERERKARDSGLAD